MKANLKKMLSLAALGMSLLSNTAPTWAGSVSTPEVYIATNKGIPYATGSMVGARYSTDSEQMIGCGIYIRSTVVPEPYVYCYAHDRIPNNSLACGSKDPKHLEAVQGMTDSSYILFEVADRTNGQCGNIAIYNSSGHLK
jgi:hypothetical protein